MHKDLYWLKLLHFNDGKSLITNKEFFLAPDGNTNAKSELRETITQILQNPQTACQYPARYKWLHSKIHLSQADQICPKVDAFIKEEFTSIDIIFTSERYDSPASVFGHTFLKLNSSSVPYAINYAAKVPDETNSLGYIYKGLSGAFLARYSLIPYALKDYEYRSGEFRDLIKFKLNLQKDEINNILLHLYEIKDATENYYFLSHNCSSELIRLIDIARYGSHLTQKLDNVVIPIDTVYILQENNFISNISIQKSKLKVFYQLIIKLNQEEKDMLFKIISHDYSVNKLKKVTHITPLGKSNIILAGISYFEIKSTKEKLSTADTYPFMKLVQLSVEQNLSTDFKKETHLDENPVSNKFHKVYTGVSSNFNAKHNAILGYRYLYRNRFDLVDAMKKNGSVQLLDIECKVEDKKIRIEKFTLLNLEAMPISNQFFKETINKITLGAKRVFEEDKLYSYLNYGLGYRYRYNKYFDYQVYAKIGAYYNDEDIYLGSLETSLEYNYKNIFISELRIEANQYTNTKSETLVHWNNYIKILKSTSIDLSYIHKTYNDEIKLLYNFYF